MVFPDVQALLPHRPPFLFVDRIVTLSDEKICAVKDVLASEPFFKGHFPGHPVMPGVLIVEALAQTGAILAYKVTGLDPGSRTMYLLGLDKVKFRKSVVPGDRLLLEVVPVRRGSSVWKMLGEARVGDEVVCSAEFLAAVGKEV